MSQEIRIAAIDDHPIFLEGLCRAIRTLPHLKIVEQGATASDARRIAGDVRPDVMLLDIGIPGGGIPAARAISTHVPSVKIIMLTGSESDEHVEAALLAGAKGYLLKGAKISEVAEAVACVHSGRPYVTGEIASRLLVSRLSAQGAMTASQVEKLNYREKQVLECASRGLTNRDIASELGLQVRTIKNYMSRILQKLQARNRVAAIATFKQA